MYRQNLSHICAMVSSPNEAGGVRANQRGQWVDSSEAYKDSEWSHHSTRGIGHKYFTTTASTKLGSFPQMKGMKPLCITLISLDRCFRG